MGVVSGDMADFVPERESELRLVVHQGHQLTGDVHIAPGNRECVLDRGVESRKVQRLARIGDTRISSDSPADGFDISRARASLRPAEFPDDLRMLALRP